MCEAQCFFRIYLDDKRASFFAQMALFKVSVFYVLLQITAILIGVNGEIAWSRSDRLMIYHLS